jgi:hypothetical protein
VRRQTRAVAALLQASKGLSSNYLFMEDDFVVCPHAIRTLEYIISKADAYYQGKIAEHNCNNKISSAVLCCRMTTRVR